MKRDNKKALYESIMTSVAKEVKKALNEENNNTGLILALEDWKKQIIDITLDIRKNGLVYMDSRHTNKIEEKLNECVSIIDDAQNILRNRKDY